MKISDLLLEAKNDAKFSFADISPEAKQNGRMRLNSVVGISATTYKKMMPYLGPASATDFAQKYDAFVSAFPTEAKAISDFRGGQTGPGEMVCYYVFNNVGVGGNLPMDIFVDGREFAEMKGVSVTKKDDNIGDVELGAGGNSAATKFIKELEEFNETYSDITGEDLPDWPGPNGEVNTSVLKKWLEIDLKKEMEKNFGGGKKPIKLSLERDGDLKRQKDDDVILNVNKSKNLVALKDLINSKVQVKDDLQFVDQAIKRWAEGIAGLYLKNKTFFLVDLDTLKSVHFGKLKKENLTIQRVTRGRVKARFIFGKKAIK